MHRGDLNQNVKEGKVRALLRENRKIAALPPPPPEPRRPMHPMEDVRFIPRSAARNRVFPTTEEELSGESLNLKRPSRDLKSATEKIVEKTMKHAATEPIRSQDGDEKVMVERSYLKEKVPKGMSPSTTTPNTSFSAPRRSFVEKVVCVVDASTATPNIREEKVKLNYKVMKGGEPAKKVASPKLEIQIKEQPDISWFVPNSPPIPTMGKRFVHPTEMAMTISNQPKPSTVSRMQKPSIDDGLIIRIPTQDDKILQEKKKIQAVFCTWRKIGKKAKEPEQENAKEEMSHQHPIPKGFGVVVEDTSGHRCDWSLFQVWNNLAYVTCSVPYRLVWNKNEGQYELEFSRIQQFGFGLQITANVVDILSWWRRFKVILNGKSNPMKYVRFAALVVKVLLKACHFKAVFGINKVKRFHEIALEITPASKPFLLALGKGATAAFLVGYSSYLFLYSGMGLAFYTTADQQGWNWGLADFIQSFACYTRQTFAWMESDNCPDAFAFLSDVPFQEWLLGGLGMFTYFSGTLVQEQATLMIMTSSLTLLSLSRNSKKFTNTSAVDTDKILAAAHTTPCSYYNFLERGAGVLSSFVGLLLSATLADVACDIPYCLDQMFNNSNSSVLPSATRIFLLFAAFILACISAMQIDELQDSVVDQDNESSLPRDIRRLILYLQRVFRKAVGIGYRSLYVMNFPFLLMYCSVVASLVCFTYEQENGKKD